VNSPARRRLALIAGVIGNALEWYDFVVYAFFAATIGRLFFPSGDETVSLLTSLATFGVGFIVRPVGGIVLGSYADRAGRKKALLLTIGLMGVGTAVIGLAPTYRSIGPYAALIIVVARLIQGFSAGGELGSATAFLMEHAARNRRGLAASWQQSSQAATLLLASLAGSAVSGLLSPPDLEAWGWRLPFLIGPIIIVPTGLFMRRAIDESPAFIALKSAPTQPVRNVFREQGRQLAAGFGLVVVWTVSMYFFMVYLPTYATRQLRLPQSGSLFANSMALVVLAVLCPLFGRLSDTIGRKPLMLIGAGAIALLTYPAVSMLAQRPSLLMLSGVQLLMAVLIASFTGPAPAALAELYPPAVRSSGMSLAYNSAVTLFGGFAPFISTWLIAATGSNLAPAVYVVAAALLSFLALGFMKETAHYVADSLRTSVQA
jgi:MHS family proline/betaine transporter-like MFS transporter